MKKTFLIFLTLSIFMLGVCLMGCKKDTTPKITVDFNDDEGEITHGAAGFLYGISEEGVPTKELIYALNPDVLATKTANGLQHPIGDVNHVAGEFLAAGGSYINVYLQDMYPGWYYYLFDENGGRQNIDYSADMRARAGQYLDYLAESPYKDNLVVNIFNESDNGEWYGWFQFWNEEKWDWDRTAGYATDRDGEGNFVGTHFVDTPANRQKFYEDFKYIYDMAKERGLKVSGPSFCGFTEVFFEEFLTFCKENNCLPDVMIWHELGGDFYDWWQYHYDTYRALENKVGVEPIPVLINEYGRMCDNGKPDSAVKWIGRLEKTKVSACIAYWRLANNLCDLASDANTPTASWWVYRWYGQMKGHTYTASYENNVDNLVYAMTSSDGGKITSLVTSKDGSVVLTYKNVSKVSNAKKFLMTVEAVDFNGLSTETFSPITVDCRIVELDKKGNLTVDLNGLVSTAAYNISFVPYTEDVQIVETSVLPVRYEAEKAVYSGYEEVTGAYAQSGPMLYKGTENASVSFIVNVQKTGKQKISVVYGNGDINDGFGTAYASSDRTDAYLFVSVDGGEKRKVTFPSTLKYYYTDALPLYFDLTEGIHTVTFARSNGDEICHGNVSLDFIQLEYVGDSENTFEKTYLPDEDYFEDNLETGYMCVLPYDGYYLVGSNKIGQVGQIYLSVNSERIGVFSASQFKDGAKIYMRKGINYISFQSSVSSNDVTLNVRYAPTQTSVLSATRAEVEGGELSQSEFSPTGYVIKGVNSANSGYVKYSVQAEASAKYALRIIYSNNEENGVHAYNTDLVERYVCIDLNGTNLGRYYFKNTESDDNYSSVVIYVSLTAGENALTFYNDGEYLWKDTPATIPNIAGIELNKAVG